MLTPGHDVAGVAETEVIALGVKAVGTIFVGKNRIKLYFVLNVNKPCFHRTILNFVLTLIL